MHETETYIYTRLRKTSPVELQLFPVCVSQTSCVCQTRTYMLRHAVRPVCELAELQHQR